MRENRHPAGDVEGHVPALRRYARSLIGPESPDPVACADTMVREVVERALRQGQLSAFENPRIWLYATLTTCNRARNDARQGPQPPGAPPSTGLVRIRAPGLQERLAQIPLEEREALLLVVVEGFSYAQAASILGLTRPGVATRVARARRQLGGLQEAAPCAKGLSPRPRPTYLRLVK